MAIITERRVLISQRHAGFVLDTSPNPANGVPWDQVELTEEYLAPRGGVPYHVGQDWRVEMTLRNLIAGVWTVLDLTDATLLLTVTNPLTGFIITRSSAIAAELKIDADPALGKFVVIFANAETPTKGRHEFRLVGTKSSSQELLLKGKIDMLAATLTS